MTLDGGRMLAAILAIGAGAWVGGLLTVIVLSTSSRRTIASADRVALFRDFGRRFAVVMGVTAPFVVVPAVLLASTEPGPSTVSILLLAIGLLLATAIGILQARRMTSLRTAHPADTSSRTVQRNATIAAALRTVLVLGYLALLVWIVGSSISMLRPTTSRQPAAAAELA